MKVVGVIPARAGSKRIPKKNLQSLGARMVVEWTIEAAEDSDLADVVLTSDLDLSNLGERFRFRERPLELAKDDIPMLPVVRDAVQWYESKWGKTDAVMLLQPTSPFRSAEDINGALELYRIMNAMSVVSVTEGIPPVRLHEPDGRQLERGYYDRQKHKCYVRNGAIFLVSRLLLDMGFLWSHKPALYKMPRIRSIEIDEPEDLQIAQALVEQGLVA